MKVFDSHQALGGHVKSHQNMMQKFQYLQSHRNSTDPTVPYFNPLSKGLGITSSGAFMINYSASRENHRGNDTGLILSSSLSRAPDYYASSSSVTLSGASMPTALPLSSPRENVSFNNPLGLAPYGGSTASSCQFNLEVVRCFINRYPYLSRHFLETVKDHNLSNHPRACVICSLCPCYFMNNVLDYLGCIPRTRLDINKFFGIESRVFASCLLPPPPLHSHSTLSPMFPREYIRTLTSGRENKRCLSQDLANEIRMMRVLERPRISLSSQVSWVEDRPENEMLLFKDSDNSCSSGSQNPTGGEECEAKLDLSLHL